MEKYRNKFYNIIDNKSRGKIMTKRRILILLTVILLLNSCVAVVAGAAGGAVGYYCGTTSKCDGK